MRWSFIVLIGVTGIGIAGPAFAEPLSLDAAVRAAIARSPALIAAARSADGADARVAQAETAWLPRVTVESKYVFAGPLPELVIDTGLTPPGAAGPLVVQRTMGSEHHFTAGATVGWRAVDFGARDVAADAAESAARAARLDGEARATELAWGVRSAWLGARLLEEVAAVTERSLASTAADLKVAVARKEAGLGNTVAVAGLEARAAELEARRTDALIGRERAVSTLRLLTGLPKGAPVELDGDLPTTEGAAAADGMPATVARLEALTEAARESHEALGRGYWPTLDVFAGFGVQYPETSFAEDGWNISYQAGVALTWPVFDGMLRSRQRDEAAAKIAELEALGQAAREEAERSAVDADARLASARASALAAVRAEQTAEVYARAARAAETAGIGTDLEVRKAEEVLDQARLAALRSRYEAAMARSDALRAHGMTGLARTSHSVQAPSADPRASARRSGVRRPRHGAAMPPGDRRPLAAHSLAPRRSRPELCEKCGPGGEESGGQGGGAAREAREVGSAREALPADEVREAREGQEVVP